MIGCKERPGKFGKLHYPNKISLIWHSKIKFFKLIHIFKKRKVVIYLSDSAHLMNINGVSSIKSDHFVTVFLISSFSNFSFDL